jgi:hypothetical protein
MLRPHTVHPSNYLANVMESASIELVELAAIEHMESKGVTL